MQIRNPAEAAIYRAAIAAVAMKEETLAVGSRAVVFLGGKRLTYRPGLPGAVGERSVTVTVGLSDLESQNLDSLVAQRALSALTVGHEFRDDEIEFIQEDPVFLESVRSAATEARRKLVPSMLHRNRDSIRISVSFTSPGTRGAFLREREV